VLGHHQAQRRQVEHLAGLNPHHRRVGQVRATAATPVGHMPDHLVGLGDLGQVRAGGAGLLAGPAPPGRLVGAACGPRGLGKPIRGGRLGRVGGVLAEPTLQLSDPGLQRGDQAGLLGVDRGQGSVGRPQLRDDRSVDRGGSLQIELGDGIAAS
jgi:hypothetical protein